MSDRAFTTQLDSGVSQDFDGLFHNTGIELRLSSAGTLVGGRAYFPSANPSNYKWEVYRLSDSALMASVDLHALFPSPTLSAWNSFTSSQFDTPGDVALSAYPGESYVCCISTSRDVIFKNTSVSYPISSGGIVTGQQARDLTGGSSPAMPTNTNTAIYYGADVEVNAAASAPALPLRIVRRPIAKPLMAQRRTRTATPVRAQVNPPIPLRAITQPRRLRGLRGWRTRMATPVRAQVNPPMALAAIVQPRRLRGLRIWRARIGRVPLAGAAPPSAPPLPLACPRHPARPVRRPRRTVTMLPTPSAAPLPLRTAPHRNVPIPRRRTRLGRVPLIPAPPSAPALPLAQRRRVARPPARIWRTRMCCVPLVGLAPPIVTGTVVLPPGLIPIRTFTAGEILTGHRLTRFRFDLYSRTEAALGRLYGVQQGHVDFTSSASVHSGGAMQVVDIGQTVDWLNDRVRPVVIIEGLPEIRLGMFVFSEAPEQWGDTGRSWPVKLLDKTSILDQDKIDVTYALPAGTVITDTVVTLIASTGETNIAVTPSAATLSGPLVWQPTTTKLKIVNDLLAAAGYFSLFCNGDGQFIGRPYVRPAARPIRYEFLDGDKAIYSPDFVKDVDLFGIPNKFIAVGQGDATTAALTSTATNTNPDSRYSYAARGNRWIADGATGVEAASQAVLDDYARRRLIELTSPTSSIDVAHMMVPDLTFNDAVRLRRVPAGIDARHVVTKMVVSFDATALVKSSLQEVVDL